MTYQSGPVKSITLGLNIKCSSFSATHGVSGAMARFHFKVNKPLPDRLRCFSVTVASGNIRMQVKRICKQECKWFQTRGSQKTLRKRQSYRLVSTGRCEHCVGLGFNQSCHRPYSQRHGSNALWDATDHQVSLSLWGNQCF